MPKIIQDFIGAAAIVGALAMFFVFASSRWIDGVEGELRSLAERTHAQDTKSAAFETILAEIRDRLEKIDKKIDRVSR